MGVRGLIRAAALAGLVLAVGLGIGGDDGLVRHLELHSGNVGRLGAHNTVARTPRLAPSPMPQAAERAEATLVAQAVVTQAARELRGGGQPLLLGEPRGEPRLLPRQAGQPPADIAAAIRAYDWPWEHAERVFWCESRFDRLAEGRAGERGVAQIASVHIPAIKAMGFTWDQMYEVVPNIAVAYALYLSKGKTWLDWRWSRGCHGL